MFAGRKLRRRIDDALAVASPLALAQAMDSQISNRTPEDLRGIIADSLKRMDESERAQLAMYVNLNEPDDLIGHRFSAFLRQNPRSMAALDPETVDSILLTLGEIPVVERVKRRLSAPASALLAGLIAIAVLPLAAQYAHQKGMLQGLSETGIPAPIVPFIQRIAARPASAATPKHLARHVTPRPVKHRAVAQHRPPAAHHHAVVATVHHPVRRPSAVVWKFDRRNNPYFNRDRWRHPYIGDRTPLGARARLSVNSYLHAVIAGNLPLALSHLGLPRNGNTSAIAELPIVSRYTQVRIVGSNQRADGREQVEARILTGAREYFEEFAVEQDGPAVRIVDHYYIPVNRPAQLARLTRTQ